MIPADTPGAAGEMKSSTPIVVGHEAHIVAEEDGGPRGDPSMPVSERNAYPNRVLMCPTHHTLIDKDNGIHFSVEELHKMKRDHEESVERRRISVGDSQQKSSQVRRELLLEAASASRGRMISRWVAAGVSAELAQALADDDNVGAPTRLGRELPRAGLTILEGDFGSGKSVTIERIHAADIAASLDDDNAPLPVYLDAQSVATPLADALRTAADKLGNPQRLGLRLVLDGLDEAGSARASQLLDEARAIVFAWPNCQIVATTRLGMNLSYEERLAYPPLTDDEATTLVERLGGRPAVLWSKPAVIREMLHLPLFAIIATLRQQAGAEVPSSQGTFLEALADGALRRTRHPPIQARDALKRLARLALESGGAVLAAELGDEDVARSALETRLIVRQGRALRFALPVVEQYFAAQTVLDSGVEGLDLHDLRLLDRWRYSLMLAVTVGSWQQVIALLDPLAAVHPGLAAWLIANAVPEMAPAANSALPADLECARRLRHALGSWVNALGPLGQRLGLTDSSGRLRTVGVSVQHNRVFAALKTGAAAGVAVTQLPYDLDPFSLQASDGSEWSPSLWGTAPADFPAWPWQWALQWVSSGIELVLRTKSLSLPESEPFQAERRWAVAKSIMRKGSLAHQPISVDQLRPAATRLLSDMADRGTSFYQPSPSRRLFISRDEIAHFIQELNSGDIEGYSRDRIIACNRLRPVGAPT